MKLHVLRALMYITKMNGTGGHRSFAFCSAFSLSILGFATQESAGIRSLRLAPECVHWLIVLCESPVAKRGWVRDW